MLAIFSSSRAVAAFENARESIFSSTLSDIAVGLRIIVGFVLVTNIYVGNLSFKTTESELREAFGRYGEVSRATIVMDRETNRSRGFGFVEMPNSQEARAALTGLNGANLGDRSITCNEARERESRGPRGGGGGGGGRFESSGRGNRGSY